MSRPLATGLSHVALAVPLLEPALERLQRLLGVGATPILENTAQQVRLATLDLGNTRIEVLQPTDPNSPLGRFLARNPRGGLHHISLSVGDLGLALGQAAAAGARQAGGTGRSVHGERLAFLDPRDVLGVLLELEEAATPTPGDAPPR